MAPVFIIGGVGGFGIAVTAVILRRIARRRKEKRSDSKQVIEYQTTGCCLSTEGLFSETEGLLETCNTVCSPCIQKSEPPLSVDTTSARSGAIIESHQVTTSSPLMPKSISRLSSITFDSKVCVDAYASLLAKEVLHEDSGDDTDTSTEELGSMNENEEHHAMLQHEEGLRVAVDTEPTMDPLGESTGEADRESAAHWVQGDYEQNTEFLLEPKSPVIRQPTPLRVPEGRISASPNSNPLPTPHALLEFDYDAHGDGGTDVNSGDIPAPSLFLQDAVLSSEMGNSPETQREASSVIISTSSARAARERTIVSFTAAPLASVPALEDVVSGNPIPSTEILVHEEVPDVMTTVTGGPADTDLSSSDNENTDGDFVSLEEEQSLPQIPFMRNLSTAPAPEEEESKSNVSSDLPPSNTDTEPGVTLFEVCDKNTPITPTVTRERSDLASSEGIATDGPAATRPLREEDIERMKALASPPRVEDSDKENAFQSASTSPERLSRKPWRSERISSVFSRKSSVRRLRIPDRIRRRNMLSQKNNATSQ